VDLAAARGLDLGDPDGEVAAAWIAILVILVATVLVVNASVSRPADLFKG
jgi:hypothetical protein